MIIMVVVVVVVVVMMYVDGIFFVKTMCSIATVAFCMMQIYASTVPQHPGDGPNSSLVSVPNFASQTKCEEGSTHNTDYNFTHL
jgi:hypothetical protein